MDRKFPDITKHLDYDSSCEQARREFGGRNLAKVLLEIYNVIPVDEIDIRKRYVDVIGCWLDESIPYRAPELFPRWCWPKAAKYLNKVFESTITLFESQTNESTPSSSSQTTSTMWLQETNRIFNDL